MEIPEERLKRLLAYCHLDDPTENDLSNLEDAYYSAIGYMDEAGIRDPDPGKHPNRKAQYDRLVNVMTLDRFDQLGQQAAAGKLEENPAFRQELNQMKLSEPGGSST